MSSITHVAPVVSSRENWSLLPGARRGVIQMSGRRRKGIYMSPAAFIRSIGWISLSSSDLRESLGLRTGLIFLRPILAGVCCLASQPHLWGSRA